MGVDYTAYSAIGVMVPREALWRKVRVRCCTHPPGDGKFCSACGKPVWAERSEPREGYDPDDCLWNGHRVAETEGMDVSPRFVVCVKGGCASAGESSGTKRLGLDFAALAEAKEELRGMLEKEGIGWREDAFGLWTILLCG